MDTILHPTDAQWGVYNDALAGCWHGDKLDSTMEQRVIDFTTCVMYNEIDDSLKSVFITHGQDLQIHLLHPYHRMDINEIGERLVDLLKASLGMNFTHRQTGPKMLGLIVDENQTT